MLTDACGKSYLVSLDNIDPNSTTAVVGKQILQRFKIKHGQLVKHLKILQNLIGRLLRIVLMFLLKKVLIL